MKLRVFKTRKNGRNFIKTLLLRMNETNFLHFIKDTYIIRLDSMSTFDRGEIFRSYHGLWTPNGAFFHWNQELLGLGRRIGQINSGAFGVFLAELSAPILVQWVPCPCFPLFHHYFYKKLSLYIHIPNIYLGLGFEFGLQRIWDLAFVGP